MKKLPIGIQSIREILEEDYVYVDKTGFALEMIESGKHYFMSRPRRFGKSLFLNTLEEIFKGNKKLFRGLEISKKGYKWEVCPVLHFDFSQIDSSSGQLDVNLKEAIIKKAKSVGIVTEGSSMQIHLSGLIEGLAKKSRVVVLVDEYDSSIINNLKRPKIAEKNRDILKDFFGTLKSLDRYLKFTFVTGVSKFSQVSLFSGPNNLTDITMDPKYSAMMGYTEEELQHTFGNFIQAIAKKRGKPISDKIVAQEIRSWYNGYRFSERELSVYNPYSTLRYFNSKKAESYWYSSGTPSFLIDEVKKHPSSIVSLQGTSAFKSTLSDISRLDKIFLPALMFQTGYLTIQKYNPEENSYDLDFPNREVKEAFFQSLIHEFTEIDPLDLKRSSKEIKTDLEKLQLARFVNSMNDHFAKMPYNVFQDAKEGFYQAVFFTFLETSEIHTTAEMATNFGRIDLVTELPKTICIFELKLDKTAQKALSQAREKKYKDRFTHQKKNILVIGINFSSKTRNISQWKARLFSSSGKLIRSFSLKKA